MSVYNSVCPGSVGIALQQPLVSWGEKLFKSTYFNGALAIMKCALRILLSLIIVPLLILPWAVGKLICRITKPRIAYAGLSLVPEFAEIPIESEEDLGLKINDLSEEFNRLPRPENMTDEDHERLKASLYVMLDNVQERRRWVCPDKDELRERFCREVTLYLQAILKKMRLGELKEDQKVVVLRELAVISSHCYPTWLEGSAKLFSEIFREKSAATNQILSYVQDYKEAIILSLCDVGGHWHDLNRMRVYYGEELGLITSRSDYDKYADLGRKPSPHDSLLRWLFFQKYQDPGKLVSSICSRINSKGYSISIYELLLQIVTDSNRYENPADYVAEHYYSEDLYEISPAGVEVLLRHLGVIN